MSIKVVGEQKSVRTCKAVFEHEVDGEIQQSEITVRYYSRTTKSIKEARLQRELKLKEKPNEPYWNSEALASTVESLPDLVDAKGKPHKISVEFLDTLDINNLEAISTAIEEDIRPKAQPQT